MDNRTDNEIEKKYIELSKKYKLPKFNEIDSELELSSFDNANFLLKDALRSIVDKLDFYVNLITNLLQPDAASLSSMHETRFFAQDERNEVYSLFKIIMKHYRSAILLILENDEKKQADFLNRFFNEWLGIKKELLLYLEKMKESWDKETTIDEDLGYLG